MYICVLLHYNMIKKKIMSLYQILFNLSFFLNFEVINRDRFIIAIL